MTHLSFFFLKDTPPPEIYTLPLHDALPISRRITHVCTVPPMAAALFREPIPEDTALRWMNIGGDRPARGLDQPVPFEGRNLYGPTQTTVIVTGPAVGVAAPPDPPPPNCRPFDTTPTDVLDAVGHAG